MASLDGDTRSGNAGSETATKTSSNCFSVPVATYRLQLNRRFTFADAKKQLPYLKGLGITHLYLSPIFKARSGSLHGYDVTDHSAFNPEIGTAEDFSDLTAAVHALGMGIILDIVPNHMAVMADDNNWWLDVLENGPAATFASYFDIDWKPVRESMRNRLLVPVLGDRYGAELKSGRIRVQFDALNGSFSAYYGEHRFPLDPKEYPRIFKTSAAGLAGIDALDRQEFESLLDDFGRLPARCDVAVEDKVRRYRDKEVHKRRLARLCKRSAAIADYIQTAVEKLNGHLDAPESFEALGELLDAQPYRLAFWKVAGEEINYRRFFDVNQLAALRIEDAEVFAATHRFILELVAAGHVDGLRVDHIDGLHDPKAYLDTLRAALEASAGAKRHYLIVEKILAAHERLNEEWPIHGTTGYEFSALLIGWLNNEYGVPSLSRTYSQYVTQQEDYAEVVYQSKKLVMRSSLAAEMAVLTMQLDRIAQSNRDTADFTQYALRDALTEIIALFPVYRTYISERGISADDRQFILWAIGAARGRSSAADRTIYDFILDVLVGDHSAEKSETRRQSILHFAMKFQQVTAPVTAKGVEDTSFYRYNRFIAVNEVGSDPRMLSVSMTALHKANEERARRWPHSLLTSSTHDTKRGEDVRYRLCVLAELSKEWRQHVAKWSRLNRSHRQILDSGPAPSRSDEYLLFQTIIGFWPIDPITMNPNEHSNLITRLKEYALKAIREAKDRTSWIDPQPQYENAVMNFIDGLFIGARGKRFLANLNSLLARIAYFGLLNSVSAIALKYTSPGIPDCYQGAELAELVLVDPDNRRAVDFERRMQILVEMQRDYTKTTALQVVSGLLTTWQDGRLKWFIVWRLLQLRGEIPAVFIAGDYEALVVKGPYAEHVCAYARHQEGRAVLVVVSRWMATLMNTNPLQSHSTIDWKDTYIELTPRLIDSKFEDIFTQLSVAPEAQTSQSEVEKLLILKVSKLLLHLPISVLSKIM